MKICYLAPPDNIHTQRWVEYFADNGNEVHLIFRGSLPEYKKENINMHLLKIVRPYVPFISFPINLLYEVIQVRKLIRDINADVLHVHYVTEYGAIGAFAGLIPFVVTVWGSDVLVDPYKSNVFKIIVYLTLKKAEIITTTADFMKEFLIKKYNLAENKIKQIRWGINLDIFYRGYDDEVKVLKKELEIKNRVPIILSNRTMAQNYKIESIIEAIPNIIGLYPNTIFIFTKGYGSTEFENKVRNKMKKLDIESNIRIISRFIGPREMAIYLNMSDIFISIPQTDQFAASIMEGMACGSIPIVSNKDVYRQYLDDGKNAFFVNPESPQEIADKIIYCLGHPELKDEFRKINCKIIEDKENWKKNAKQMEELYKNLINLRRIQ